MESLSNLLYSLYRGTPYHDDWLIACLSGAWQGLLGDKVAQVSRPLKMRSLELIVEVDDAAWLATLSSMSRDLLGRIRSATRGEVQRLSFVPKKTS
jgi:hypothetical protein